MASSINLNAGDSICFIQIRAMGDMLLSTPLLKALKETFPLVNIYVVAQQLPAQVLVNNPYIRNTLIYPQKSAPLSEFFRFQTKMRSYNYKLTIDLLSTPGSALISWLSGAEHRIGYYLKWRSWAYTQPVLRRVDPVYNPVSKFDQMHGIVDLPHNVLPEIFLASEDDKWASDFIVSNDLKGKDIIGIAPWSKRDWRRWDIENWCRLVKVIHEKNNPVFILFASESEFNFLHGLLTLKHMQLKWAGADHILKAAALMKHCQCLIGMDNGLKHVAVAAGIPTFTIYKGSDPEVWNPPDMPQHKAIDLRRSIRAESETVHVIRELESYLHNLSMEKQQLEI